MCILKEVNSFIKNGISTFRDASRGSYKDDSSEVSSIRKEIMEKDNNSSDDKKNLIEDRKKVGRDVRKSYNEIVLNHG
jgi:hypothetical protein